MLQGTTLANEPRGCRTSRPAIAGKPRCSVYQLWQKI